MNTDSRTPLTDREQLGKLGEDLVATRFGGVLSEDKYDMVKDMTIAGRNVEVKTQSRHPNGSFTINTKHRTNLKKCVDVDRLIFVEYDVTSSIRIWECTNRDFFTIRTRPTSREPRGRLMACFPVDKMTLLEIVKDTALSERMRRLSNSAVFKK